MSQIIYTNCDVIQIGCYLYSDPGLFVTAPAGIYSDGYYVYYVYGTNGRVADIGLCQATTTTTTIIENFLAAETNDEITTEGSDPILIEQ